MGRCRCPSPAERDSGPSLSFRHAGTVSASGRADQPAATATKSTPWSALRCTRWRTGRAPTGRTRRAGRQRALDAEDVQRHPVRWRPCVGGPAERVLSSAVLDHDHAETIVSEDTVQPAVGQIKGCEQSGLGHTASGQLVQHLQGERRHAVQRGKHMDRALPRSLQSVLVGTKPSWPRSRDHPESMKSVGPTAAVERWHNSGGGGTGGRRFSGGSLSPNPN